MSISEIDQHNWSIETLNKAYRQGYMFGLSGEPQKACPYDSDVIAATWEAGWTDGSAQADQIRVRTVEIIEEHLTQPGRDRPEFRLAKPLRDILPRRRQAFGNEERPQR